MYQNKSGFLSSIPPVTKNIIIINVLLLLATSVAERFGIDLNRYLGLHFFASGNFNPVQLITYMFMHGSFSHLFFNMFAVFMFGSTLEYVWGKKRYLIYYFITGIGAALIQELVYEIRIHSIIQQLSPEIVMTVKNEGAALLSTNRNYVDPLAGGLNLLMNSVTVGASGSIFGILLAFGMLFPNSSLYVMFIPIPVKAKYFVIFYGLLELYLGIANYTGDNVAHFAHLGGMLFGFLMIIYWKKKDINDKNINNDGRRFFR